MITLKTKTKFSIPFGRNFRTEFIYLTIERLEIDNNNVTPLGYYYFIDENLTVQKLDDIVRTPILWQQIELGELNGLAALTSSVHLKNNVLQRLLQFTMIKLEEEQQTNYGTLATDFEII